jgi:hypothetical protein
VQIGQVRDADTVVRGVETGNRDVVMEKARAAWAIVLCSR